MSKIKLKGCPFCNSVDAIVRLMLGSTRFYHVMCNECGCLGPLVEEWDSKKKGIELASIAWNKRKTNSLQV